MSVKKVGQTLNYLKTLIRKVGIKIFDVEWTGLYLTEKNNKTFLNSLEFDENELCSHQKKIQ